MASSEQTAGEKRRAYNGPAFFSHGFRPFFFSAALFAGLVIPLWMAAFSHGYAIGPEGNALGWHGHEMVFGYVAAVIAGFVMTAIPNWTGRLPVMGMPLVLLFLLWLAGRVAMFVGGNGLLTSTIDCLFLIVVAGLAWCEVLAGKNWRNLPVCLLVGLLAVSNVLDHAGDALGFPYQFGLRMALALVTTLMMLIGGRVIPSFTTNWMKKQRMAVMPAPFGLYDKVALLFAVIALLSWIIDPDAKAVGVGFLIAAVVHTIRLIRWRGWQCGKDPLVLILHIAYFWIPVALGLMGLAILRPDLLTSAHALHALTTGAIGQLTMAIMTRASLGHCGRELRAGAGTVLIYLLIFVGALLRVSLPFTGVSYALGMSIAGFIWAAGFLLFAALYGPMLFAPRR
ncbi:NnrS family protein [Parasphingorhabdus halotolerans]|uniref:NnrS family protein n=1 Tax=Parasphingorhabdus halotolerans TaxID=2725558 RepID=A0A6H2DPJ8_9SPHN|nr:NnrS family protein [Parasphingorhabdus halotolerans]QJB70310.1 NnrS family protein [Parasphingorhabdus halotolerans]